METPKFVKHKDNGRIFEYQEAFAARLGKDLLAYEPEEVPKRKKRVAKKATPKVDSFDFGND